MGDGRPEWSDRLRQVFKEQPTAAPSSAPADDPARQRPAQRRSSAPGAATRPPISRQLRPSRPELRPDP